MKKLFKNTMMISAIAAISACGISTQEEYNFKAASGTVSFKEWCQSSRLNGCAVNSSGSVSQATWDSSMRIAKTVFTSQSRINLTRSDMERPSVARLFEVAGANEIRALINKIPWQTLTLGKSVADMDNLSRPGSIDFKGLRLTTSGRSRFVWTLPKEISVSGVEISTPTGERLNLTKIDFSKAELLSFVTSTKTIQDIPVNFFAIENLTNPKALTVDSVIKAVSDVIFEPGFNWRNSIDISLAEEGIDVLRQEISKASNDPLFDLIDSALGNTSSLVIGGLSQKDILGAQLNSSVRCQMKFHRVPVVGDLTASIDFASRFGISTMTREGTKVTGKIFGLKTSIGTMDSISIDGAKINLKIGFINIPIDTQSSAEGPEITDISCVNL